MSTWRVHGRSSWTVLATVLVAVIGLVLLSGCGGGGDDSGVKRFDRVTLFNLTGFEVKDVRIMLQTGPAGDPQPELWWADTGPGTGIQSPDGLHLADVPPGAAVGLSLNHVQEEEHPGGVHRAICHAVIDHDGDPATPPVELRCVVDAGEDILHSATFYVLPLPDNHPDFPEEPRVRLCGEGMMNTRLLQGHVRDW